MLTHTLLAMPFAERAGYAARMALIGILAVFGVLAVLWGSLALFRFLLEYFTNKKTAKTVEAPAPAPLPVAVDNNDDALIAVISAAVAATIAGESGVENPSFRVVSFRRAAVASESISHNN